jgi:hypothetical protein
MANIAENMGSTPAVLSGFNRYVPGNGRSLSKGVTFSLLCVSSCFFPSPIILQEHAVT